jgi:hypothetical protein
VTPADHVLTAATMQSVLKRNEVSFLRVRK